MGENTRRIYQERLIRPKTENTRIASTLTRIVEKDKEKPQKRIAQEHGVHGTGTGRPGESSSGGNAAYSPVLARGDAAEASARKAAHHTQKGRYHESKFQYHKETAITYTERITTAQQGPISQNSQRKLLPAHSLPTPQELDPFRNTKPPPIPSQEYGAYSNGPDVRLPAICTTDEKEHRTRAEKERKEDKEHRQTEQLPSLRSVIPKECFQREHHDRAAPPPHHTSGPTPSNITWESRTLRAVRPPSSTTATIGKERLFDPTNHHHHHHHHHHEHYHLQTQQHAQNHTKYQTQLNYSSHPPPSLQPQQSHPPAPVFPPHLHQHYHQHNPQQRHDRPQRYRDEANIDTYTEPRVKFKEVRWEKGRDDSESGGISPRTVTKEGKKKEKKERRGG